MAVVGIGVDVVDVARFSAALERTPGLLRRVLTDAEAMDRPAAGLAARFAAKEALAKALGAPRGLRWHDAEVRRDLDGRPRLHASGTVAEVLERLGASGMHLSLSHDGGVAVAMVVVES